MQIQDLAYLLVNKYQIFKETLVNWNKMPEPKTWEQMKTHLRNEYQALKEVNALSISESILNTTIIVDQLKTIKKVHSKTPKNTSKQVWRKWWTLR